MCISAPTDFVQRASWEGSLAPLQWLADQMGRDLVQRDPAKARIEELERELEQLKKNA